MTRTKTIATLWCTALAAALAAYGCGSSSTIDTGTGGGTGTAGRTGGGSGGGVVIINTGGMTGSGGMTGGLGGMTGGGMGGMNQPPADAGAPMCMNNAVCTAGSTCDMACRANGQNGTRTCTCGNNNRLNCNTPPCITPDAGAPPPPVDAGPRPDAGPMCPNNTQNNRPCMVGTSPSPCARNAGGGNMQTCTCALPPATDAGAPAADAGPDAAVPPPPQARYTCM